MSTLRSALIDFLKNTSLAPRRSANGSTRSDDDPKRPESTQSGAPLVGRRSTSRGTHCRCGHYLRGQLEDEFLAWEDEIAEQHQCLVETVALRVRKLRYLNLLGLPFVVLPLLFLTFFLEGLSLAPMAWMAVGITVMGVCTGLEQRLQKPVQTSQQFLDTYTLETFLEQRVLPRKVIDQ